MPNKRLLILSALVAASTMAHAGDTLEQFAAKCDRIIGVTVPDFDCDSGTLVPTTHYANGKCDRPNVLNEECDPGSRFQVLPGSNNDAYAVAHCRKDGQTAAGQYNDIAVIQHNKKNGATCFYQGALESLSHNGNVTAPSKGIGTPEFWMTPGAIANSSFPCLKCHDNGPLIRSPYLSQVKGTDGKPLLPGAGDSSFNRIGEPYCFVGKDFEHWKAYQVKVSGNTCNGCHRMGVNNVSIVGTARVLGIRATGEIGQDGQPSKNPHSSDSPIWMLPNQIVFKPDVKAHADAIKACAATFNPNGPLPNSPACEISQYTCLHTGFPYPPGLTLTGSHFVVWRPTEKPSNGYWYVIRGSDGSSFTQQWGAPGDVPVPGDYDRDGKIDFAVWRPGDGVWYVIKSSDGDSLGRQWGQKGDIPVPADYDRDGKIDFAVWRPKEPPSDGYWYIIRSSDGSSFTQQWGAPGDVPVPGDYNGDGAIDFAVWRPSNGNWHIKDGVNGTESVQQWGASGDVPVPGHYHDGNDTRTDYAVWRPSNGNWHIKNSLNGTESVQQWGASGDVPVPGHYDSDTKTDFAVWRPSNGYWYVIRSSDGSSVQQQWGLGGDIPIPKKNG